MHKLWLVARQEYRKIAGKKTFLIATVGIPVLIIVLMVVIVVVIISAEDKRPVGYVDHAGVLAPGAFEQVEDRVKRLDIIAFEDEAGAQAALREGDIQAFYVIPEDYLETATVQNFYLDEEPSDEARQDFWNFMRANLAQQLPERLQERAFHGASLSIRSVDGRRETGEEDFIAIMAPFIAAIFFFIAVLSAGGYMLQAIADEKENRTMEVLSTSLSPEQLIGGKALGLIAVVLTQIGLWTITLIVAVLIGGQFIPELQDVTLPFGMVLVMVLYFFPAFALVSGFMITIGAMVTELQQGQQISGLVNMLFTAPMFLTTVVFASPNHPVIVAFSLFPTTSFITILMRWGFGVIPFWQLAVSWTLLVASAVASIWFAARAFRIGMLRYGQRLRLKGLLAAMQESR
ncbi:MAG: ABC transporter permease [Anaerolineae bacterium]|nr:ABC transporter permease [Anaerolineae bacterium]